SVTRHALPSGEGFAGGGSGLERPVARTVADVRAGTDAVVAGAGDYGGGKRRYRRGPAERPAVTASDHRSRLSLKKRTTFPQALSATSGRSRERRKPCPTPGYTV